MSFRLTSIAIATAVLGMGAQASTPAVGTLTPDALRSICLSPVAALLADDRTRSQRFHDLTSALSGAPLPGSGGR